MNYIDFEDTIFILNMRIRLVRDILRLNPPPELFMEKCLNDLVFIDQILAALAQMLLDHGAGNDEFGYASDTEWQFNQLLTEFTLESSPFSARAFPEITDRIAALRSSSDTRRKAFDESGAPVETARSEPVVSSAEMCGLLGSV
jgi:hypothetical protein